MNRQTKKRRPRTKRALVVLLTALAILCLCVALVITGIYWLDVRPQIRGILDNAQGGW